MITCQFSSIKFEGSIRRKLDLLAWVCLLSGPFMVTAQEMKNWESLIRGITEKYSAIDSFEFLVEREYYLTPEFREYLRKETSASGDLGRRIQGRCRFYAKGEKFGWNLNVAREDGAVVQDKSGAWNGDVWQTLDRGGESGNVIKVLPRRSGLRESAGFTGVPFSSAFAFLVPISPKPDMTRMEMVEDLVNHRVTLKKLGDKKVWWDAISSTDSIKFRKVNIGGKIRDTFVFEVTGNAFGGDRGKVARWKVWFDEDHPTFPIRVESYVESSSKIASRFEVTGPFKRVSGIDIPTAYTTKGFDSSGEFTGTTSIGNVVVKEVSLGGEIEDSRFGFDPAVASKIIDLETGNVVEIE